NDKSLKKFFQSFLKDADIGEETKDKVVVDFANYPKFPAKYCSYSEKALKKILPLIRLADKEQNDFWENQKWYKKWKSGLKERKREILKRLSEIDFAQEKVDYSKAVLTDVNKGKGEIPFPKGLFRTFKNIEKADEFKNLNLTQASYLIYGRHSELAHIKYWTSPKDIREQLHQELKQHSLNNPIAEKVILEMMQVVADIWDYYGEGEDGFFSQINIEVARSLKKSAAEKQR